MTVSLHEPSVARRSDGRWGVFCTACSASAHEYVYPCKAFPDDPDWPPAVLMEVPRWRLNLPVGGAGSTDLRSLDGCSSA